MNDTDKQKEIFLETECIGCERLTLPKSKLTRISRNHCKYRQIATHLKTPDFVMCDMLCERYRAPTQAEIAFYQKHGDNAISQNEKWKARGRRKQKKGTEATRQKVKIMLKSGTLKQWEIAEKCGIRQARVSQIKRGL